MVYTPIVGALLPLDSLMLYRVLKMWLLTVLLFAAVPVLNAQTRSRLDTTTFVVMGEGLAAGMANYGLSQEVQEWSFAAQMARQFNTLFPQPLIQGPGLETMFGLSTPAARLPTYPQTTVREFPVNPFKKAGEVDGPPLFVFNLSLPNWRLADSLTRRPAWPIIQPQNPQQTTVNLILGFPALLFDTSVPLWTQLEYAQAMSATFALVELGYFEALEAAAFGDPDRIPPAATFRANYTTVVRGLKRNHGEVMVTTIPDPLSTAYFVTAATAARLTQTEPALFRERYGVRPDDYVTRKGMYAIGNQLLEGVTSTLPAHSVLTAATAREVRTRVNALNAVILDVARENGALVYDLNRFFAVVRESGAVAAGRRLTADYLGGFYSLDGVYPSITGHALIANDVLRFVNASYGTSFPAVDLASVVARDTALSIKVPE